MKAEMSPRNILLVEDSDEHAELLRRAFDPATYTVTRTTTLAETRACLQDAAAFDLVIADLMLPDGQGTALLNEASVSGSVPLILMTGQGNEEVAVQAMRAGAMDYIVKSATSFTDMPRMAERAWREWRNIQARQKAEDALQRKLVLVETIAALSSRFIGVFVLHEALEFTLRDVGELMGASQASLCQFSAVNDSANCIQEWYAKGTPSPSLGPVLTKEQLPWSLALLQTGRVAVADPVDNLPVEALQDKCYLAESGIEACHFVPIHIRDRIGAVLVIVHPPGSLDEEGDHYQLLAIAGEILGQALTRASYEQSERTARAITETMRQAMLTLSSSLDLTEVLDQLLTYLARILPYDSCTVLLLEGESPRIVASRGIPGFFDQSWSLIATENPIVGEMAATMGSIYLADASTDPRFQPWMGTDPARGWIGAPLIIGDRISGYLTLGSRHPDIYGEVEANLALSFATQAAIAIENARLFQEAQNLATRDGLTELYNRRHFLALAQDELRRASRYGLPIAAITLDIDHFKLVNDNYGHAVGDQVLRQTALLIRDEVRDIDIVGRLGGEEFGLVLPGSDVTAALDVAERLRARIADTVYRSNKAAIHITISLGVSDNGEGRTEFDALLLSADQALYRAKESGRNTVRGGQTR